MNTQPSTSFSDLANRFRRFNFRDETPESMSVVYINNNSIGNRYINWKSVCAKTNVHEDDNVITLDRVYDIAAGASCDWRHLFEGLHYGLIVGPRVHAAVKECLDILQNDVPPEDDGKKVKHVNRVGGVNYVSKPTFHEWNLTERIGKILSSAFFADRNDKQLYSDQFNYVYDSHAGWSRSV